MTTTSPTPADPDATRPTAARTPRRPVTRAEYLDALRFIENAQVVNLIDQAQRDMRSSPAGRTRLVTTTALLTGMTLASRRHAGKVILSEVADILARRLPPSARTHLRLPDWPHDARGFEAAYHAVRHTFHAMEAVMDPSPLPKHRLTRTQVKHLRREADQEVLASRRALLIIVTNNLLESSLSRVRSYLDTHWDGSLCLDGTPIRTWSRGVASKDEITATDPEAGWYSRQGDHRDPADGPDPASAEGQKTAKKRFMFGYEICLAVTGEPTSTPLGGSTTSRRTDPSGLPGLPALAPAFVMDRPGYDPAGNGILTLLDLRRRGYKVGDLAVDRLFNASTPESFHIPVRDLGYRPIWDYRIDQLGRQGSHGGAILVDGTWFCPEMPEGLITASIDLLKKRIDKATWRHRINARAAYRLRPKAAADSRGARRMMCPAAGTHPTAACPRKTKSLGRGNDLQIIDITPTPAGPPEVCRRESLTFARDIGIRYWQELDHGTARWVHGYFRLRNRVEHFHGYAKAHEALERSHTRRIRGLAAQSILAAFQLAHANGRKIDAWLDTLPTPGRAPQRRPSDRYKHRAHGDWTPTGYLTEKQSKPQAPHAQDSA